MPNPDKQCIFYGKWRSGSKICSDGMDANNPCCLRCFCEVHGMTLAAPKVEGKSFHEILEDAVVDGNITLAGARELMQIIIKAKQTKGV